MATRCLLNFRHKSLLSFPETCATVISSCVSTLSRGRGVRKVSRRMVDREGRQSPLTIARPTEVRVHADGERETGEGKRQRPPRVSRVLVKSWQRILVTDTLHYARTQLGQSIPPSLEELHRPSVYPFDYIQITITNNYRKRKGAAVRF